MIDLKKLEEDMDKATVDKSDLFDFYNAYWDTLIDEIKELRTSCTDLQRQYDTGYHVPDSHDRPHIVGGDFQSDKYPTCPRGKVPLSVKDPTAQDLLWEYAQRRRSVDAQFSHDLEWVLRKNGYVPKEP